MVVQEPEQALYFFSNSAFRIRVIVVAAVCIALLDPALIQIACPLPDLRIALAAPSNPQHL